MHGPGRPTGGLDAVCCFENVFSAHATIRQLVLSHSTKLQADALRQVSRAVRAAVNSNVETVIMELNVPRCDAELATVFPVANRLRVVIPNLGVGTAGRAPGRAGLPHLTPELTVCPLLGHTSATSPAFVTKLQALTLSLGIISSVDEITAAVADFLSRCSNLQELRVNWHDEEGCGSNVCFKGEGSTAAQRRASMQRQLAALCDSSTSFMAPESWPACCCLDSFATTSFHSETDDSCLSAAARTPSLARLDVNTDEGDICTALASVSALQRLTSLNLSSPNHDSSALGDEVLAAIGQLSSLRQLVMGGTLLPSTDDRDATIPASWSALSSLTRLDLTDCGQLVVAPLTALVALECLQMTDAVVFERLSALFALTRLTRLDGPLEFVGPDGDDSGDDGDDDEDAGCGGKVLEVPQQWRDGLQHLTWGNYSSNSSAMLAQLSSLTCLRLNSVPITRDVCRILGSLARLAQLHMWRCLVRLDDGWAATEDRPALHAVQHVQIESCGYSVILAQLLARCVHLPPDVELHAFSHDYLLQPLYISGWGRGWLPAALATSRQGGYAVVVADDGDVDHYLAAVAAMGPSQQQGFRDVVWLGEDVTLAGFSRLLSCPQQPPLRLEVGTPAQSDRSLFYPQGFPCLTPTPAYFRSLVGASAPRLVSLVLAGCEYLTNRDVAMLAGSCFALTLLQLTGAWRLTDMALHSLALGCRRLDTLELTQARVTEEGVVVALTVLAELRELALGDLPAAALMHLEGRVQREMPAADYLQWVVARPRIGNKCLSWTRRRVGGELLVA